MGKIENATQAAKALQNITNKPFSAQTMHQNLKKADCPPSPAPNVQQLLAIYKAQTPPTHPGDANPDLMMSRPSDCLTLGATLTVLISKDHDYQVTNPKVYYYHSDLEVWLFEGRIKEECSNKSELFWAQKATNTLITAITLAESTLPTSLPLSPSSLALLGAPLQHRHASGQSVASGHSGYSTGPPPSTSSAGAELGDGRSGVSSPDQMRTHLILVLQISSQLANGIFSKDSLLQYVQYKEWKLVAYHWKQESSSIKKSYPSLTTSVVRELFVSQPHFYSKWVTKFEALPSFPTLLAWYERAPNATSPTDFEAWGMVRNEYSFTHLNARLITLGAQWSGSKFLGVGPPLAESSKCKPDVESPEKKEKKKETM
ncbi:hypothetical protein FA15DRAFT_709548 [Coprinopsis marcescibilis]|uniref:Uncharacterized protein n=1 Tax=Coprinopsis marcescibilis TaxID=230819 RepID=A0A5C3KGJ8_COPMA|nr:hypothetical protein FA15DRAFT_709548 [Coprinopsis marcescibilis]